MSFNAVAGTQYRIAVDGNGGTTGTFTLEWLPALRRARRHHRWARARSTGTAGNDVIVGSAGNDTIDAGGGNDRICLGWRQRHHHRRHGQRPEYGGTGNDCSDQGAVADGDDRSPATPAADTANYGARTAARTSASTGSPTTGAPARRTTSATVER